MDSIIVGSTWIDRIQEIRKTNRGVDWIGCVLELSSGKVDLLEVLTEIDDNCRGDA